MSHPVEFGLAISNSHPSGTGSYTYEGRFHVVVENLAYDKQVAIWAQTASGWQAISASYHSSLPGNRELWQAPASNSEQAFAARYTVNGATYWDNNGGANYLFPQAFDEFIALAGWEYKVVLGTASLGGGNLHVDIGVQDLAYHKVVGIVYTLDEWQTTQIGFASFSHQMKSGLQVWHLMLATGASTAVEFAVFYQVAGSEYWDNNFQRNYRVQLGIPLRWGMN